MKRAISKPERPKLPRFAAGERFTEQTFVRMARRLGHTDAQARQLFLDALEANQIWNVNTTGLLGDTPIFEAEPTANFP